MPRGARTDDVTADVARHLSSQLTEMERLIDKMVSADFVRHVTSDLNRPLDQQLAAEEVRTRLSRSSSGRVLAVFCDTAGPRGRGCSIVYTESYVPRLVRCFLKVVLLVYIHVLVGVHFYIGAASLFSFN